ALLYDNVWNIVSQRDALGNTVTNRYDQYGTPTNTATLDNQQATLSSVKFSYDANGNRTNQSVWWGTNAPIVTSYIYDGQSRLVQTIDPLGHTNTVIYNEIGKQQITIDA